MARIELDETVVSGASPYSAGQTLQFTVEGPGRVDLDKSFLLIPVEELASATNEYVDNVLSLIENMTLYLNDRVVEQVDNAGFLMSTYASKLKSLDWRNGEGVSQLGMDVKGHELTVTEGTPNTVAFSGADVEGTAIRIAKWGVVAGYPIPLRYLGFRFKDGQLPCYNRLRWRVQLRLRDNVEALVASSGSPTYKINDPTLILHRTIDPAEETAFAARLSGGFEMQYLSIQHATQTGSAAAVFSWDLNVNQNVDSQIVIQRLTTVIADQTAQSISTFAHNGITSAYFQYPSGLRWPASGSFDLTEATGTYAMMDDLKTAKATLDDYMDSHDDAGLGCGPNINGLVANSDLDFMMAFAPASHENGTARLITTGALTAGATFSVYSLSKAILRVSSSGPELIN